MSHALANLRLPRMQSQFIALSGGMDLTTAPIAKSHRDALIALNVQPSIGGGFNRIEGYECIDGQIVPSKMTAVFLKTDRPLSADIPPDTVLIGTTPCYPLEVCQGELVVAVQGRLTASVGQTFTLVGQTYRLSAPPYLPGNLSAADYQQWQAKAFAAGVRQVEAVQGTGQILGVAELDHRLLAIRDSGQGAQLSLADNGLRWRSAPTRYRTLLRSVEQPELLKAGTLLRTNAEHRLIEAIVKTDGNATLFTDTRFTEGAEVYANGVKVGTAGRSEPIKLVGGQVWQFVYHNFYGSPNSTYAYGCNGEQVIELRPDGTIIPIELPLANPICLAVHRNHLFVAFAGGQLGHSAVGEPLNWSGLLGAEQFALGNEITALASAAGGVLLIGCRHKTAALYGSSRADWVLKDLSSVGVHYGTLQAGFMPIAVSDHGVIRIDQTERFGDFELNELDTSRRLGFSPQQNPMAFSSVNAQGNQLRFYSRSSFHLCIMVKPDGSTVSSYFIYPKTVKGVWQSPNHTYLAFDDGKVYRQNGECCSFAGEPIDWHIKLSFNHCGSPMQIKSWHSAEVQATAKGVLSFSYRFDLDYNAAHHAVNLTKPLAATGDGGRWNENSWNDFLWSAANYSTPTFPLYGYSRNISLSFSGRSVSDPQFELSGLILNYIVRRNYRV